MKLIIVFSVLIATAYSCINQQKKSETGREIRSNLVSVTRQTRETRNWVFCFGSVQFILFFQQQTNKVRGLCLSSWEKEENGKMRKEESAGFTGLTGLMGSYLRGRPVCLPY